MFSGQLVAVTKLSVKEFITSLAKNFHSSQKKMGQISLILPQENFLQSFKDCEPPELSDSSSLEELRISFSI